MPRANIHPKMNKIAFHMNGQFLFNTLSTLVAKNDKFDSDYNLDQHPAYNEVATVNESNAQITKFRQQARAVNYSLLKKKNPNE